MAYEGKANPAQTPHALHLEERSRLAVSGVEEVVSFDEGEVVVQTVKGLLIIRGSSLKVERLEKTSGDLTVSGSVTELCYEQSGTGGGFWSKLFR